MTDDAVPEKDRATVELRDRLGRDPLLIQAFEAYREAYRRFQEDVPQWRSFFTDHHKWALGAFLAVFEAGWCDRDTIPVPREAVAAKVHEQWMASKRQQGVTSRRSETGEELMVPYEQLSEAAKDLDRGTVTAVLDAVDALAGKDDTIPVPREDDAELDAELEFLSYPHQAASISPIVIAGIADRARTALARTKETTTDEPN